MKTFLTSAIFGIALLPVTAGATDKLSAHQSCIANSSSPLFINNASTQPTEFKMADTERNVVLIVRVCNIETTNDASITILDSAGNNAVGVETGNCGIIGGDVIVVKVPGQSEANLCFDLLNSHGPL